MAESIQQKLTKLSPGDAAFFSQRYADFDKRLSEAEKRWDASLARFKDLKIVTYHNSWPNFAQRFHLQVIGYVEPRPGIPPTPSHTLELMDEMKRQQIKLIIVEPYFDLKTPNAIARETGAKVVVLAPSVGGADDTRDYIALFDYDLKVLVEAAAATGAK
jgi:zinc/manganese transport system substrate-binding protein